MAHTHETHEYHQGGAAFGMASGFMLAIAAIVLALVIAGIVLLIAQPWGDEQDVDVVPNVPVADEPADGSEGGGGEGGGEQVQ